MDDAAPRPSSPPVPDGPLDVRLVVTWTLVTAVGFALLGALFHNFPIAYRMPPAFRHFGRFDLQAAVFGGIAFGALPALLVGAVQRLVVRRRVRLPRRWIIAPALGVGSLHFVFDGFPDAGDMTLAVIASGAAMGWYQWRLLRAPSRVSPAWVALTVVAWYSGWAVGMQLLDAAGRLDAPWTPSLGAQQHAVLGAAVGVAYGIVTGIMLARHARRTPLDAMQRAISDHMYRG